MADEFGDTQSGTLNFRYLLPEHDGLLSAAVNMVDHMTQREETLRRLDRRREAIARFVKMFVRPNGIECLWTPQLAGALEQLARCQPFLPRTG